MNIPQDVLDILKIFYKSGYEAYIVGGCVRDMILKKTPKDYDITTNATPEQVKKIFTSYDIIPTGEQYGTLTIIINHIGYEITTFRKDGNYSDGRRPDLVAFGDNIKDDLARRDFTMNAIAYNPQTGLIDPYNGINDIYNKIVRCVGNPDERFNEDALRIMRAIRFACKYDFKIEKNTMISLYDNIDKIGVLSSERVREELCQILLHMKNHEEYIYKLFEVLFPEFKRCRKVTQFNPYHIYNVDKHIIESIIQSKKDIVIRLTMLFHDMGKCSTKQIKDELETFPNHAKTSYLIARKYMNNLKFSNKMKKEVLYLILHHADKIKTTEFDIKFMLSKVNKLSTGNINEFEIFKKLIDVKDADIKAQNSLLYLERHIKNNIIRNILYNIIDSNQPYKLSQLNINGNDLIKQFNYKGESIGIILNKCLNFIIYYPQYNNKYDLYNFIKSNCNMIKFFKNEY